MTVSILGSARRRRRATLGALLTAGSLAGCATVDRSVPTGAVPYDYHVRHPVVLADEPSILDVFPMGAEGHLDQRTLSQLADFAADFRRYGQGGVLLRVPDASADPAATERTVEAVRHALARLGVRGRIDVSPYRVTDPRLATPLHLSYLKLQARVASHCGDWPDDLNSGATVNGWDNRSYYNLGCATTKTLAAQIDDPRDVLAPRAEDPTDVQLRTRAIGLLRKGADPGTEWTGATLAEPIISLGGN